MPAALSRGLKLLDILARSPKPVSFSQLSSRLDDLNRASLSRLLLELAASGHLQRDPDSGRYLPGPALGVFAALRSPGRTALLIDRYAGLMQDVAERYGLTSILLERVPGALVCIHKVQQEGSVHMQDIGHINDAPDQPWLQLLALHDPALGPRCHPADLARLREQGYAYDDQGLRPGFRRLGFPLLGEANDMIGVLGVGGSLTEMADDRLAALVNEIQRQLRHDPPRHSPSQLNRQPDSGGHP